MPHRQGSGPVSDHPPSTIEGRPVSAPTASARLTSCPGCGQIDGVEQTSRTPRVAAWKCTPVRNGLGDLAGQPRAASRLLRPLAAPQQLDATRSVLRAIITLADDAATLSEQELRDRLLALADRAKLAQRPIVEDPGGVTVPR